jgi:CRP-like cAMP-binding protein
MQSEASSKRLEAVSTHPLAELLACPPSTSSLLTASAQSIGFESGEVIFSQSGLCRGLYLVVAGQLLRRTDRLSMRITLGAARSGDLVELAAALGDRIHTYTLVAQTSGSVLLLPVDALHQAFQGYPPLRMRLLEELAREVSRAYHLCSLTSLTRVRRRTGPAPNGAQAV